MNLGNLGSGVLAGEGVVTRCIGIEIVVPLPPRKCFDYFFSLIITNKRLSPVWKFITFLLYNMKNVT